jgi:twitching motility protein PilT
VETFRNILQAALEGGASDIHIKADRPIVFRINRQLIPVESPAPTSFWINEVIANVVPEHLQRRLEEDHEIDMALSLPDLGRFRVNVFQQRGGYVLALRLVKTIVPGFSELNLPEIVRRLAEIPHGIIILAGAPGSGKSTKLASMLQHLNETQRRHIITLEDPIEYLFEDRHSVIEQREVGLDTNSFASGLRNVLRQDPDVLVIGEMRDLHSVQAAVSAANVGTKVFSTLHTGDAPRSIQRILEFFPSNEREHAQRQLAGTLHAVICQKLIRSPTGALVPALEILINTASVEKILETNQLEKLQGAIELGTGDGMQTFEQALVAMINNKQITADEALAHAPNPEALKMRMQGVVLSETRRILKARD